jgi:deazaflavin-dependent oxidoreductase (nitroreductase family)
MNPAARVLYLLLGSTATAPLFAPLHSAAYRLLGGRLVGRLLGVDIILLMTQGRRSGRPRTTPLLAVRDADRLLVVASNGGSDRVPDWYRNLRSDPRVSVQIGGAVRSMQARQAKGEELGPLWQRAIRAYPGYAVYRQRARRDIPLIVLEPYPAGT